MSFLSGLASIAKSTFGFLTGNSIGSQIARTVLTGFAVKKMIDARQVETNQDDLSIQEEAPDYGVREQANADPTAKIPVVYGRAFTSGKVFDVRMDNNNQTMWYAMALSENTGALLSTGASCVFTFRRIFYNNSRVVFQNDGITVDHTVDVNGKIDYSLKDLVKIYCYQGSTEDTSQKAPLGYTLSSAVNGYDVFPQWTSSHTAYNLVFALIKVDYDKEKNAAGLGSFVVELENDMTLPGDVLFDYMNSQRYGGNINVTKINGDTTGNGLKALNTYSESHSQFTDNRPATLKTLGPFPSTALSETYATTTPLTINIGDIGGSVDDFYGDDLPSSGEVRVYISFTGVDDISVTFTFPTPTDATGYTTFSGNYFAWARQFRYPGLLGNADAVNNINDVLTNTTFTLTNQTSDFSYTINLQQAIEGSWVTKESRTVNVTLT